MLDLPKPKRLSLSDAVAHIIKHFGKSKNEDEILVSLHGALCDGTLIAIGKLITYEDFYSQNEVNIPAKVWQQFHGSSKFRDWIGKTFIPADIIENLKRSKDISEPPFYFHPYIATSAIDDWLGLSIKAKQVSKAPNPLPVARGSVHIPSSPYAVAATDLDYVRCITEGYIEVYQLAALACDLSPPAMQTNRQFWDDLADPRVVPLGLICHKLTEAVKYRSIEPRESQYTTLLPQYQHIRLSDAVAWLEKQHGISISERLRDYSKQYAGVPAYENHPQAEVVPSSEKRTITTHIPGVEAQEEFAKKALNLLANIPKKIPVYYLTQKKFAPEVVISMLGSLQILPSSPDRKEQLESDVAAFVETLWAMPLEELEALYKQAKQEAHDKKESTGIIVADPGQNVEDILGIFIATYTQENKRSATEGRSSQTVLNAFYQKYPAYRKTVHSIDSALFKKLWSRHSKWKNQRGRISTNCAE